MFLLEFSRIILGIISPRTFWLSEDYLTSHSLTVGPWCPSSPSAGCPLGTFVPCPESECCHSGLYFLTNVPPGSSLVACCLSSSVPSLMFLTTRRYSVLPDDYHQLPESQMFQPDWCSWHVWRCWCSSRQADVPVACRYPCWAVQDPMHRPLLLRCLLSLWVEHYPWNILTQHTWQLLPTPISAWLVLDNSLHNLNYCENPSGLKMFQSSHLLNVLANTSSMWHLSH